MSPYAKRLYQSVIEGDSSVVREAIAKKQALFSHEDRQKNRILHWACSGSSTEILALVLSTDIPTDVLDGMNKHGMTPLMIAVQTDACDHIQLLLEHGANPNLFDRCVDDEAALHRAKSTQAVEALLKHGADLEQRNILGLTPLLSAIRYGNHHTIEALLSAGADCQARVDSSGIAVRDPYNRACQRRQQVQGGTALHFAVERPDQATLVRHLIGLGVDPEVRNDQDQTPLDLIHARQNAQLRGNGVPLEEAALRRASTITAEPSRDRPTDSRSRL